VRAPAGNGGGRPAAVAGPRRRAYDRGTMKARTRNELKLWAVVGLMLLAMAAYVLSLDESDPQARPDGVEEIEHGE